MRHYFQWALFVAFSAPWLGTSARAGAEDIRIGQSVGFTGPQAGNVKELTDGAKLWINAVNARGGVNGQKIILDSLDDGYDPKRAGENARQLIESGVMALFLSRGTQLVEPLADTASVAVVAPSSGAMIMHDPVKRVVFNVRSKFQSEAERAIKHLSIVGKNRIGVVHVDDTFGKDGLAGAERGLKDANIKPAWILAFVSESASHQSCLSARVPKACPGSGYQAFLYGCRRIHIRQGHG